jgi:S-adenosylmethionine-diacylglycerol 3-amino-3-carboxypropyl transferase
VGYDRPQFPGHALNHRNTLGIAERLEEAWFRMLYGRNLVYNTSWEDPAVDLRTLRLGPEDRVLAITSAGCNVLDYALEGPRRVIAVDANPRQTALLELKMAAIRRLSWEDAFAIFGRGHHPGFAGLYRARLRGELTPFARRFWDRRTAWFDKDGTSFYARGLTGLVMRGVQWRLRADPALGESVRELFAQVDIEAQRRFYDDRVRARFWTPFMRWFLGTPVFLSLVGVPMPQRRLLAGQHPAGVSATIQGMIDELFRTVPAHSNYFWGVYVFGAYTPGRCPRYLEPAGFAALKAGLVDRIEAHTCTVTEYLERDGPPLTRAVLLDHMDWMSSYYPEALQAEWDALVRRMKPGGRILFRSANVDPPFLDTLRIVGKPLKEWLRLHPEEARALSAADRVHTYMSFHIGDVPGAA